MKPQNISKDAAKKIILQAQLLSGNTGAGKGKKAVKQTIEKLGYIQIDTISVINRAHHHTLWTRHNGYQDQMLHILQAKDRAVFEYWGHAMSYLSMSDYRYFLSRMKNFRNPTNRWIKHHFERCKHIIEPVLDRIKNEGPLSSKDFSSPENDKRTWWNWKPAKSALEYLLWRGDLMVSERKNFHKVYDLRERILPEHINTSMPSKEETGQFLVQRALSSFGIANEREILNYLQPAAARGLDFQLASSEQINKTIHNCIDSGEVIPLKLEKEQNKKYYALSALIAGANVLPQTSSQVFFLSQFDNLIIQRERVRRIFDFNYSLECYVPAPKRKYGYFVVPVLWGDNFVARFDPKANRKKKTLIIKNLSFEDNLKDFDEFLPPFADHLAKFAKFNGCEKIKIEKLSEPKIKKELVVLTRKMI